MKRISSLLKTVGKKSWEAATSETFVGIESPQKI
jgi:hypothetical protein